jgi:hypothetical protein
MLRANKNTIIKWLKMIEIKDCSRNPCPCADSYRRLLVTRPTNPYDNKKVNHEIKVQEIKYNKCFNKNEPSGKKKRD